MPARQAYISYSGDMDMADHHPHHVGGYGQTAYLQAGGGLVADSIPANRVSGVYK